MFYARNATDTCSNYLHVLRAYNVIKKNILIFVAVHLNKYTQIVDQGDRLIEIK